MTLRIIEELIDDIDGKRAAETVRFGIDGDMYLIDLSTANARKLRGIYAPFIAAARRPRPGTAVRGRAGARRGAPRDRAALNAARHPQAVSIRAWVRESGYTGWDPGKRGRVPNTVVADYRAAAAANGSAP